MNGEEQPAKSFGSGITNPEFSSLSELYCICSFTHRVQVLNAFRSLY